MPRADFKFCFPKRVHYAEIDAQAIVFNSRYLEYADIGITEYWRAVGIVLSPASGAPEFNVAKATVEYKKPIKLDELVDLWLRVHHIGRTSMTTLFEIHGNGKDDIRAHGEIISVHVDACTGRPQALPRAIIDAFEMFEGRLLQITEKEQ